MLGEYILLLHDIIREAPKLLLKKKEKKKIKSPISRAVEQHYLLFTYLGEELHDVVVLLDLGLRREVRVAVIAGDFASEAAFPHGVHRCCSSHGAHGKRAHLSTGGGGAHGGALHHGAGGLQGELHLD